MQLARGPRNAVGGGAGALRWPPRSRLTFPYASARQKMLAALCVLAAARCNVEPILGLAPPARGAEPKPARYRAPRQAAPDDASDDSSAMIFNLPCPDDTYDYDGCVSPICELNTTSFPPSCGVIDGTPCSSCSVRSAASIRIDYASLNLDQNAVSGEIGRLANDGITVDKFYRDGCHNTVPQPLVMNALATPGEINNDHMIYPSGPGFMWGLQQQSVNASEPSNDCEGAQSFYGGAISTQIFNASSVDVPVVTMSSGLFGFQSDGDDDFTGGVVVYESADGASQNPLTDTIITSLFFRGGTDRECPGGSHATCATIAAGAADVPYTCTGEDDSFVTEAFDLSGLGARTARLYMRLYAGGYDTDGAGGHILPYIDIVSFELQPATCDGCRPHAAPPTTWNQCDDEPLMRALCSSAIDITNETSPLATSIGTGDLFFFSPTGPGMARARRRDANCGHGGKDALYKIELQPYTMVKITHHSRVFSSGSGWAMDSSCPDRARIEYTCRIEFITNASDSFLPPEYIINRNNFKTTAWYFVEIFPRQGIANSGDALTLEWEISSTLPVSPCDSAVDLATKTSPLDSSDLPRALDPNYNSVACGYGAETVFKLQLMPNTGVSMRSATDNTSVIVYALWATGDECPTHPNAISGDAIATGQCQMQSDSRTYISNDGTAPMTVWYFVAASRVIGEDSSSSDNTDLYDTAEIYHNQDFTLEWHVTPICNDAVDLTHATSPYGGSLNPQSHLNVIAGCGRGVDAFFKIELPPTTTLTIQQDDNTFDSVHSYAVGPQCPLDYGDLAECKDDPDTHPAIMYNPLTTPTTAWFIVTRYSTYSDDDGDFILSWALEPDWYFFVPNTNKTVAKKGRNAPSNFTTTGLDGVTWPDHTAVAIVGDNAFLFAGAHGRFSDSSAVSTVTVVRQGDGGVRRLYSTRVSPRFGARSGAAATARARWTGAGYVYSAVVSGGRPDSGDFYKDVWECTIDARLSLECTELAAMQTPRAFHAMVFYRGQLWSLGGKKDYGSDDWLDSVEYYDNVENKWHYSATAALPQPMARLSATVVQDYIAILGGQQLGGVGFIGRPQHVRLYNGTPTEYDGDFWHYLSDADNLPEPNITLDVAYNSHYVFDMMAMDMSYDGGTIAPGHSCNEFLYAFGPTVSRGTLDGIVTNDMAGDMPVGTYERIRHRLADAEAGEAPAMVHFAPFRSCSRESECNGEPDPPQCAGLVFLACTAADKAQCPATCGSCAYTAAGDTDDNDGNDPAGGGKSKKKKKKTIHIIAIVLGVLAAIAVGVGVTFAYKRRAGPFYKIKSGTFEAML